MLGEVVLSETHAFHDPPRWAAFASDWHELSAPLVPPRFPVKDSVDTKTRRDGVHSPEMQSACTPQAVKLVQLASMGGPVSTTSAGESIEASREGVEESSVDAAATDQQPVNARVRSDFGGIAAPNKHLIGHINLPHACIKIS